MALAKSLALKGDFKGAADKILTAADTKSRQHIQYGGVYGLLDMQNNQFASLSPVFVLYPELAAEVRKRLEERHQANPEDPNAAKMVMQIYRVLGRGDLADALLDKIVSKGVTDQNMLAQVIDRAVKKKDFERAIAMAETFIAQQPKPQVPPGTPAQYAGMMMMQSPRIFMQCKLGDVYWEMGNHDKAFETYKQIVDEKVDETRIAYAAICTVRKRSDEAKALVD
jgi:tetratricopeptide (TPR) repeat protein